MRDSLDHLPPRKQRELARIQEILFEEFERARERADAEWKRAAAVYRIVLFGSHARGDWVEDRRGGYFSDFDLLVVVSDARLLLPDCEIWLRAEDHIDRDPRVRTRATLITETLVELNERLRQGHFFYSDIIADGVSLYAAPGARPLARKERLDPDEALAVAEEHFEKWFPAAEGFLDNYELDRTKRRPCHAAFHLHQATEHAYAAVLTVLGNYLKRTHDLKVLHGLSVLLAPGLAVVWELPTRRERRAFERLCAAYVKGRYSLHYEITDEELTWLHQRVELLHRLADRACQTRLEALRAGKDGPGA